MPLFFLCKVMLVLFALLLRLNFLSRRCIMSPNCALRHGSVLTLKTLTRLISVSEPEWSSASASSSVSDMECSEDMYSAVMNFMYSSFSAAEYVVDVFSALMRWFFFCVKGNSRKKISHFHSHIITCKRTLLSLPFKWLQLNYTILNSLGK